MPEGRDEVISGVDLIWCRMVSRVLARAEQAGRPIARVRTSEHDILDGIALAMA